MQVAAEVWRVELRRRSRAGWKRTGWDARTFVDEFVSRSSGTADLIFISLDGTHVVHLLPVGDELESERMLAVARRELLDLPRRDFAREWGLPDSA